MDILRTRPLFLLLLCAVPAFLGGAEAQWWGAPRGGASFKHLGLATEARSAALSGAGAAWSGPGIASMQPAALTVTPLRLTFNRAWLPEQVDGTLDRVELRGPYALAFAAEIVDYGDLDGYDEDGGTAGNYGAGAWRLSAAWGRTKQSWSWGVRLSGGRYEIEDEHSWAMTGDMGVTYGLPLGLRLGTVLRHLGWATPFLHDEPSLPTELVVGVVQEGHWRDRLLGWSVGVDLRRRNGDGLAAIVAGELLFKERIALRLGYPFGEDQPGVSAGLGLYSEWIDADYAVVSDGLYGLRHQLSLSLFL